MVAKHVALLADARDVAQEDQELAFIEDQIAKLVSKRSSINKAIKKWRLKRKRILEYRKSTDTVV